MPNGLSNGRGEAGLASGIDSLCCVYVSYHISPAGFQDNLELTTWRISGKRRKKKCDKTRPVCVQCRKHKTSCNWPQSSTPKSSTSTRFSNESRTSKDVTLYPLENACPIFGQSSVRRNSPFGTDAIAPPTSLQDTSMDAIGHHLFQILISRSQAITSNTSLPPEFSFSCLLLTLVNSYPATRSGALACGAALLANSTDKLWLPLAQYYHNQTIQSIRVSLLENGGQENLSAVLLLHLYEV